MHTIAKRMGIPFKEASAVADDCVLRKWAEHWQHTARLLDNGRLVAAAVRNAIVPKRPPTGEAKANSKGRPRKR